MTTKFIFKLISTLFRLVLIYLISFVWIRYFSHSVYISLLLAIIVTIFVDLVIRLLSHKFNKKHLVSEKEQKLIDAYNNALIFSDDKDIIHFFYLIASKNHTAEKKSNYILIKNNNKNIILFPYITFRGFYSDDLVYVLNKLKNINCCKIIICVNTIEPEAEKLAEKIGEKILILNKEMTYYKLMKENNIYPNKKIEFKEKEKISFNKFLELALNKKRTKSYFFTSIILLFSSFIVKYNLYYCIMSSLLLFLSLISFINPKFNKKKIANNIFEFN